MEQQNLDLLNKATISYAYLHTNSTTHDYLLGAVAELVDNSRDAMAQNLHIDFDENNEYLSVLDDGCGMTQKEAVNVISFGFSNKRNMAGMIGQYGNGLKSGAMRIANDMIMLTKKDGQVTCLLLSRTFHRENSLQDVFVPSPAFNAEDRYHMCRTEAEAEKHRLEMSLIYKYSPFQDQESLFQQFSKINGDHGTLIIMYNMRRLLSGDLELDFKSSTDDIRLADSSEHKEDDYNSLRAYLSVLYLEPRMKIYLRKKKIMVTRLTSELVYKYKYDYLGKNLKACAVKEHEACQIAVKDAEERLRVAESDFGAHANLETSISDKNERLQRRVLSNAVEEAKKALKESKEREAKAKKAISSPTPLEIVFGVNIHHRNKYGCMFYNNGRLILPYQKGAAQKEKNDLMMSCLGVVGIVDVPYSVLAPTHNKQKFENQREFLSLLKAMNELMLKYWKQIQIGESPSGIKAFWKPFGYPNSDWTAEPVPDADTKATRYKRTGHHIQCNICLKWRNVPFQLKYLSYGIPEDWKCADHPNSMNRKCETPEEIELFKRGRAETEKQIEPAPPRKSNGIKAEIFHPSDSIEKNGKTKKTHAPEIVEVTPLPVSRGGSDRRASKTPVNYVEGKIEEKEDDEVDDEPVRKRGRNSSPKKIESKPRTFEATSSSLKRSSTHTTPSSSSTSRSRMTGAPPSSKKVAIIESSDEDEMPRAQSKRTKETSRTSNSRTSSSSLTSTSKASPVKPPPVSTRSGRAIVPPIKTTPSSSAKKDSAPSTSNGVTAKKHTEPPLEISERLELSKKTDDLKAANTTIRELLKQLAKKGCNQADKLGRLSDEKIRESMDCEQMINDFWLEKVTEPLRKAQEQSLNVIDKRPSTSAPQKVIERVEVMPEIHSELVTSMINILKWLIPHYHNDLNLPNNFKVDQTSVYSVAKRMSEVLNMNNDEDNDENS